MKVNKWDKKIPDATTLIHINQYNPDKQNFGKNISRCWQKIPYISGLVTATVLNTKNNEVKKKIPVVGDLIKKKQIMALKY